jgi:DNA-directed RNA polymerase subunit RPC12/RpoP
MHEIDFSSIQSHGSAAESLASTGRRLCPYCRSRETARSHRRGPIEKYLLRAIRVRVYRCDDCNSRFYAFSHDGAAPARGKPAA